MQSKPHSRTPLETAAAEMFDKLNRSGALDRLRRAVEGKMAGDGRRMEYVQSRTTDILKEENQELHKLDTKMLLAQTKKRVLTPELEEDVRRDIANAMKELALRDMFNEEVASLKNIRQPSKVVNESAGQQSVGGRALLENLFKHPLGKSRENRGTERKARAKSEKSNVVGNVRKVRKAVGAGEGSKHGSKAVFRKDDSSAKRYGVNAREKGVSVAVACSAPLPAESKIEDGAEASIPKDDSAQNEVRAEQAIPTQEVTKPVSSEKGNVQLEKKVAKVSGVVHARSKSTTASRPGNSADVSDFRTTAERPSLIPEIQTSPKSSAKTRKRLGEIAHAKSARQTVRLEKDIQVGEAEKLSRSSQDEKKETSLQTSIEQRANEQKDNDDPTHHDNKSTQSARSSPPIERPETAKVDGAIEGTKETSTEKSTAEKNEADVSEKLSVQPPAPNSDENPMPMEVDVAETNVLKPVDYVMSKDATDTPPKRTSSKDPTSSRSEANCDLIADTDAVQTRSDETESNTANICVEEKSGRPAITDSNVVQKICDIAPKARSMSPKRPRRLFKNEIDKGAKTSKSVNNSPFIADEGNASKKPEATAKRVREDDETPGCESPRVALASKSAGSGDQKPKRRSRETSIGIKDKNEGSNNLSKRLAVTKVASGRVRKPTGERHNVESGKGGSHRTNEEVPLRIRLKLDESELMPGKMQEKKKRNEQSGTEPEKEEPLKDENAVARKSKKRQRNERRNLSADMFKNIDADALSPTRKRHRSPPKDVLSVPEDYSEQQKVLKALSKLAEAPYAYPFLNPVDPHDAGCENYYNVITNPMNIYKITERLKASTLKAGYYASVDDVMQDIELIWLNCRKFNGDYDPVVKDAEMCINTLDILLEQEGLRKAASGRAKRRRSRIKSKDSGEQDRHQRSEKSHERRANVKTPKRNRCREKEDTVLKKPAGVNDGCFVGKSLFVFTEVGSKKAWVEVEVASFEESSCTYTIKWKETGKMTTDADFGPHSLYPVYRLGG